MTLEQLEKIYYFANGLYFHQAKLKKLKEIKETFHKVNTEPRYRAYIEDQIKETEYRISILMEKLKKM